MQILVKYEEEETEWEIIIEYKILDILNEIKDVCFRCELFYSKNQ